MRCEERKSNQMLIFRTGTAFTVEEDVGGDKK